MAPVAVLRETKSMNRIVRKTLNRSGVVEYDDREYMVTGDTVQVYIPSSRASGITGHYRNISVSVKAQRIRKFFNENEVVR